MGIEQRIERLETENRNLKRSLTMLLAGIVGTALVAFAGGRLPGVLTLLLSAGAVLALLERRRGTIPSIIRAHKIEIVGTDGMTRVALGETLDGDGAIATYDARGRFVAALDTSGRRVARTTLSELRTSYGSGRAVLGGGEATARSLQR